MVFREKLEDIITVFRKCKLKTVRQCNDHIRTKGQIMIYQTQHRKQIIKNHQIHKKQKKNKYIKKSSRGEFRSSGMESSSCSTSGTHCFACVRNLMICHKRRQVSGSETIPNGSYPRNVLHSLTVCCIITNYADDSFLFHCFSLFRFFLVFISFFA